MYDIQHKKIVKILYNCDKEDYFKRIWKFDQVKIFLVQLFKLNYLEEYTLYNCTLKLKLFYVNFLFRSKDMRGIKKH